MAFEFLINLLFWIFFNTAIKLIHVCHKNVKIDRGVENKMVKKKKNKNQHRPSHSLRARHWATWRGFRSEPVLGAGSGSSLTVMR